MLCICAKVAYLGGDKFMDQPQILIDKQKIVAVGHKLQIPKDAKFLNVSDAFVMPGMMDIHSHIGISEQKHGTPGDDCNEAGCPITANVKAIDGINPMDSAFHDALQAGITCVMAGPGSSNVVGGQFALIKTHGRVVDDMVVMAPAAMKVAFGENPKTAYGDSGNSPVTRMGIACMLREHLNQQKSEENSPWAEVFGGKIPMKAHVHRADDILSAIRIAKEFGIQVTLDHCTEGHLIATEIANSGFGAIVGPSLASKEKTELQNMSFKTPGILKEAGVRVALTTDHPVSLIQHLPLCAGYAVKFGMKMPDALAAITTDAAILAGVGDKKGRIAPGFDADIGIFTDNPILGFTHTLYTLIEGEIVYSYLDK